VGDRSITTKTVVQPITQCTCCLLQLFPIRP